MDLEDIVVFLALVGYGIYSVVFGSDSKKKKTAQQGHGGGNPFGEVFPSIEADDMDKGNGNPVQKSGQLPHATPLADIKKRVHAQAGGTPMHDATPLEGTKKVATVGPKCKSAYSLTKKTDAKRAFISSEIFNRKY
ncbi:MAG: hypothetical protein E7090_01040 [Bacteroidales bacterium]|nr:hypothetical protein [Bacteroidales bacterium]